MKIGVIIDCYKTDLISAINLAADAGANGAQIYGKPELMADSAALTKLYDVAQRRNMEISAIVADVADYQLDEKTKQEHLKRVIDFAGSKKAIVTGHIGVVPQDKNSKEYADMVKTLQVLGKAAINAGTSYGIETGPEVPEVLASFLDDVNGGVGVNLDPANLMMVHGVNAVHAVEVLHKYIVYTHAKDGVHFQDCDAEKVYHAFAVGGFEELCAQTGKLFEETPLGEGAVYFPAYLAALKRFNYDGYLTIEREVGANPQADIQLAVDFLKQQLAAL